METVSIITPTRNREKFLRNLESMVRSQTYQNVEWLIYDDSPAPSAYFSSLTDTQVRYIHSPVAVSIGEKRNRMAKLAKGQIIAHYDDDDYYSAKYLETMMERINSGYDIVKLSGWFLYSGRYRTLGFWDCSIISGIHYIWADCPPTITIFSEKDSEKLKHLYLGYGFSYVYKKQVWERGPFPDVNWNEDAPFATQANACFKLGHFKDSDGLCLHILHKNSTSRCFPQYCLPAFLIDKLFSPSSYPALRASWE
jgi:hypothetical protein